MTIPAEPSSMGRPAGKAKRRFQIVIGIALVIVALWTGGWFVLRHYVAGKIGHIEQLAADQGATLSCGEQALNGFPFRIGVRCTPLAASCPADDVSLQLAGLEAIALIYNPGHAIFAAKGPLAVAGPRGETLNANWQSLESSVRIGTSGLKRTSMVVEGLDAALRYPPRFEDPVQVKAEHAEFHVLPDDAIAGSMDLWLELTGFAPTVPGITATLPKIDASMQAIVPEAILRDRHPVEAWLASGAPVRLAGLRIDMAGLSTIIAGDFTASPSGLLSGQMTVRVNRLDALPEIAENLHPGSRDKVKRLIGPVTAFLKPVTVDGQTWREATISIRNGKAAMGFIPLGNVPPLGREAEPVEAMLAPAPAQPAMAAPAEPLAPTQDTATAPTATSPEPAPAPEPPPTDNATLAPIVPPIAAAIKRCAVAS